MTATPLVACLMPTRGRLHLLPRAVRSYRAQTYPNRVLVLVSNDPEEDTAIAAGYAGPDIITHAAMPGKTIGYYRNITAQLAVAAGATIAIHFDDDDWSHPERVESQVADLEASGRDCAGYRNGIFWLEDAGTAWQYYNGLLPFCMGNSLCYWLAVWKRSPFREINRGEDYEFLRQLDSIGYLREEPRLINGIHAGNQMRYPVERNARISPMWRRAEEWDAMCKREMVL
jgi:glycosyltransferase involved in cell wall biosynthesis